MANPMVNQALDLVYRIILTVFRQLQNMPYNGINVTLLIVILRRMTLTTMRKLWKVRTPLLFLGGMSPADTT
jgi:K+ transporter